MRVTGPNHAYYNSGYYPGNYQLKPTSPTFGRATINSNAQNENKSDVECHSRQEVFVTPTKKDLQFARNLNIANSDYKNYSSEQSQRARLMSSPESFFTPLRIPGSMRNDTAEYSKF